MLKLLTGQFNIKNPKGKSTIETITKEGSRARVLLILDITGNNAISIIENIKNIFNKDFFIDEDDLLNRFEQCMKKVNLFLKDKNEILNGIIAVQDKNELHASQAGKGEAYVIRRGKLDIILENIKIDEEKEDEETENEVFASIASGELAIDDKIILSSLRILGFATASQITTVLSEGVSEGIESIKELIETEAQKGAVMIAHARGESVFQSAEKTNLKIPRHVRASFISKIVNAFDKAVLFIAEKTQKPIDTVNKSLSSAIILILAIILIIGVRSVSVDNTFSERKEFFSSQLLKDESELEKAQNQAMLGDITSSNAILEQIEKNIKVMLKENFFKKEALALNARIQEQKDSVNKITRIKNMEERIQTSFSEKNNGIKIKGFINSGEDFFIFTKTDLYKVVMDHTEKLATITSDSEILRAEAIQDKKSIIFTLASGALVEYTDSIVSASSTNDETGFKKSIAETSYNKYLYVLSPEDNSIYKYEKRRDNFSGASSWLKEETDLSGARDLAIDGSIYVLLKDGIVKLFYKGKSVPLEIKGANPELLKDTTKIFVKTDMSFVYFLNPVKNSVIKMEIINKGLKYIQEYIFETETTINDFLVDKNEQRLIVSDSDNLYQISL